MPQLDLGSVLGPQGPKGDPGNQGTVGPRGPQGEQGDAGKDATINGVNALTIETGDGLEATMTGSAYNLKLTDKTLNAVRVVPTFTRPNLLDNWYFGRPVDQRGGMLQLAGTMLYSDAACTQAMFGSTKTTSIVKVSNIAAHPIDDSTVYVKLADCVRGYTGNGYTVDRWKLLGSVHFVKIEAGSITLRKPANTADFVYAQYFEGDTFEFLRGKTATISAMDSSGNVYSKTLLIPASGVFDSDNLYIGDNWWIDLIVLSSGDFCIRFVSTTKTETALGIQAAKLELGPTQTLAHQENGVWVLNEVPEYGEQLRRCQMYQFEAFDRTFAGQGYLAQVKAIDSTQAYGVLPTPVTMREGGIPALVTDCSAANPYGAFGIYSMGYSGGAGVITGLSLFSRVQNGVILRAVGSNFVAGNDYQIWVDNQSAHQILLNLNL